MIRSAPKPTDSENNSFHPYIYQIITEVIQERNLNIKIEKQFLSPTGPIDLVLINNANNKVFLLIEVKRSIQSVRGAGRRQARDYWNNLGSRTENPYYCVTNIELTELFRNDPKRATTKSQMVYLDTALAGDLVHSTPTDLHINYKRTINEIFDIILDLKDYHYGSNIAEFENILHETIHDRAHWHKVFIPFSYNYIRGAYLNPRNQKTINLKSIGFYQYNAERICNVMSKINFKEIFTPPIPNRNDECFKHLVIDSAFESGKDFGTGDDVSEIVNNAAINSLPVDERLGIVETDSELANLLAIITEKYSSQPLKEGECLLDPASGSGRLLTAYINTFYQGNFNPQNVIAIEKNAIFKETLSLRLGLCLLKNISPISTPQIFIQPLEKISAENLINVKRVLMNPPFISGVQSKDLKKDIIARYQQHTKKESRFKKGQFAFEIPFLELLTEMVIDGATIGTIFPSNHLYRKGTSAFREFLLDKFKIKCIVRYPRLGLFKENIKSTVILIGEKNCQNNIVDFIDISTPLSNIDLNNIINKKNITDENISINKVPYQSLIDNINNGWQDFWERSEEWAQYYNGLKSACSLLRENNGIKIKRGTLGNSGNTPLTVIKKLGYAFHSSVPKNWLLPVINNSDESMPFLMNSMDFVHSTFVPPASAYEIDTQDNLLLKSIINDYIMHPFKNEGSQQKKIKSDVTIIKNIKADNKIFKKGVVLLPRGTRRFGKISLINVEECCVSTNFITLTSKIPEENIILASWLFSIFGQCQLEYNSVSQEGMRKLEIKNLNNFFIPILSKIKNKDIQEISKPIYYKTPIDYSMPIIRDIDKVWAEICFGNDADSMLNACYSSLCLMAEIRLNLE